MRAQPLRTTIVLSSLVAVALLGCKRTPCVSSASCGDGTCAGGFCEAKSDPGTSGIFLFPPFDGGPGDGGGTSSSAGSSSGASGTPDGSVATGDAGPFSIQLTAVPTAVTISDTGTQLMVASGGVTRMHLETRVLPLNATAATQVDLNANNIFCPISVMVVRGANVFTACSTPSAAARVFNTVSGAQVGMFTPSISSSPVMVDHNRMVAVVSAASLGGIGWPNPATDGATQVLLGNSDSTNAGIGLLEAPNGDIAGMVSLSLGSTQLSYFTFSATAFTVGGPITLPAGTTVEFITSGRPVAGASPALQPVLLLAGTTQSALLFDATALRNAAGGTQLNPLKTFANLSLPMGSNIKAKISQDGTTAYYLAASGTQLCKLPLTTTSVTQVCQNLSAGCAPVDFATPVRTSGTFVACGGNGGTLDVFPAF